MVTGQTTSIKLPQSHESLCDFFKALDSAIRLCRMKGSMSNFANISPKVESLTERRFSYSHLAQLKHILPEAIEIKRVQMFDERTSCMKPELQITINPDAIEFEDNSESESKNVKLGKLFRNRIEDFYKAHPQGEEIPKEDLPEPFNRSTETLDSNVIKAFKSSLSVSATPTDRQQTFSTESHADGQPAVPVSHFPPSFKKRFENSTDLTLNHPPSTSVKGKELFKGENGSPLEVASIHSTPAGPSTATPGLQPLKRGYMSPDDGASALPNKSVRRPHSRKG